MSDNTDSARDFVSKVLSQLEAEDELVGEYGHRTTKDVPDEWLDLMNARVGRDEDAATVSLEDPAVAAGFVIGALLIEDAYANLVHSNPLVRAMVGQTGITGTMATLFRVLRERGFSSTEEHREAFIDAYGEQAHAALSQASQSDSLDLVEVVAGIDLESDDESPPNYPTGLYL